MESNKSLSQSEQELVDHIQAENANSPGFTVVEDIDHWRRMEVTSVESYRRYMTACYVVDVHKEVWGYKPDWSHLMTLTSRELNQFAEELSVQANRQSEMDAQEEEDNAKDFEALVEKTMESGAKDRQTALRWVLDAELDTEDPQCWTGDYATWKLRLPGRYRAIVEEVFAA